MMCLCIPTTREYTTFDCTFCKTALFKTSMTLYDINQKRLETIQTASRCLSKGICIIGPLARLYGSAMIGGWRVTPNIQQSIKW